MSKKERMIECGDCEAWEILPANTPHSNTQDFSLVKLNDNEALYKCECDSIVAAKHT
jgi:hypothetical protein